MTESIDLIAAYPQVVLGGNIKLYKIFPECVRRVVPLEERAMFDKLRRQVCVQRSSVRFFQIWSIFDHEFRRLADHEQVAHGSRSSSVTCVVA